MGNSEWWKTKILDIGDEIDASKIISKINDCNLNEILFVDDIEKNVINFNKIGIKAILPNDVDSLIK